MKSYSLLLLAFCILVQISCTIIGDNYGKEPWVTQVNFIVLDSVDRQHLFLTRNNVSLVDSLYMIRLGTLDTVPIQNQNGGSELPKFISGQLFTYNLDSLNNRADFKISLDNERGRDEGFIAFKIHFGSNDVDTLRIEYDWTCADFQGYSDRFCAKLNGDLIPICKNCPELSLYSKGVLVLEK